MTRIEGTLSECIEIDALYIGSYSDQDTNLDMVWEIQYSGIRQLVD